MFNVATNTSEFAVCSLPVVRFETSMTTVQSGGVPTAINCTFCITVAYSIRFLKIYVCKEFHHIVKKIKCHEHPCTSLN